MNLYPILLEPIYKEKVWGGRHLERLGRALPGDATTRIGESWEVADLSTTAPSGGGGSAARSLVVNGALAGRTLSDVVREHGAALLGRVDRGSGDSFPLLVKYLDARQNLSVQVHPSAAYAARHPEAHVKAEAWYVVEADPGALLYKGVVAGTSRADMERAIRVGAVPDLLVGVPAIAGESHYLPSGTCHALGAGVVVAEVQTPSDTTFRLHDWGRTDRGLHVEAALECMEYGPLDASGYEAPLPGEIDRPSAPRTRSIIRSEHFGVDEWRCDGAGRAEVEVRSPEVWMVIDGSVEVGSVGDDFEPVMVSKGQTVVLPSSLGTVDAPVDASLLMLRITVPPGAGGG